MGRAPPPLTPDPTPFRQASTARCPGLLPDSHRTLDSHAVVSHYVGGLNGHLVEPEVLQKIPYMEMKLRLSEHLLMRVDKLTMAHSIEARVPFLDHDVVEFATRLPPSYKLSDATGKKMLKKAAEPYLDHDMIYRQKQGFGAPMDEWFREGDFGARCLAAFERSRAAQGGLLRRRLLHRPAEGSDRRPGERELPSLDGDERRPLARVLDRRPGRLLLTRRVQETIVRMTRHGGCRQ